MTEYGKSIHPAAADENRHARRMKITKQNSLTFTFKKSREAFMVTQWNGDLSPPLEYMKEWLFKNEQGSLIIPEQSSFITHCLERAWQGEPLTFEAEFHDVPFSYFATSCL